MWSRQMNYVSDLSGALGSSIAALPDASDEQIVIPVDRAQARPSPSQTYCCVFAVGLL
jgi:hypothetical protein